ncbi:GDYXXLXY domain-containing protein [bacterium]|nr:GDYXXLXY domain-containing protein [bacterium]
MNLKKITKIILFSWLVISFCFVAKSEYTLNLGKEVLLKTVPVDPRDIVMGDYVILNYEISQFPRYKDYLFEYNQPIYVKLDVNNDNIASIDKISKEKPNGIFLKGTMGTCQSILPIFRSGKCINYGIESYYVKEGEGRKLERDLANGALVKVSIDRYGNAKVKGFEKL